MKKVKYFSMTNIQRLLLDEAEGVMKTAYNPYSNFYVGAALLSQDKRIITGSNMGNAAYGSTICAERAALLRANAMGIKMFDQIAIIARGENFETKKVIAPCGSCRQMLYEASQVSDSNLIVIMSNTKKDKIIISNINELLPLAFGPKDLGINVEKFRI